MLRTLFRLRHASNETLAPWSSSFLYFLAMFENLAWRFTNSFQNFLGARKIWESLTDSAPTFLAIHIHEKSRVQCNVISACTGSRMQYTV